MTHITILGGTGYAGAAIAQEAAGRGHQVVSVSRSVPAALPAGVEHVAGDVTDQQFLTRLVSATEHIILALSPRGTMEGHVREVAQALIPLAAAAGVRVGVIGGAGSLRVSPEGLRLVDTQEFPPEFRAEALELAEVWSQLRETEHDLDWYYISPAAGFGAHNPGERTGKYRTDDSGVLLTDADGASELSAEDLAVAVVDEVEMPKHRKARFAVAY
ncbi:NAD(P)-dependent oxidoreductase [Nesterenkonia rhizosphaerae]|uniref:NAD(P)H-binding protein n=1 Tax=Nesterenkonia rhizosphaerae TaxID=1348272 RepID=A0ABP9G6J3_9MICC